MKMLVLLSLSLAGEQHFPQSVFNNVQCLKIQGLDAVDCYCLVNVSLESIKSPDTTLNHPKTIHIQFVVLPLHLKNGTNWLVRPLDGRKRK